ncbi:CRISPR-associated protein [Bacteroides sp. OttesenSCG-928-E20]|nr:CRISPR-associated protein [Bacteroides sp. OttesenSCG-928-N06]MDL2299157.1 CRISPR-associated protein [Bacteroides sp. OttesenSCG-928-E20]MDL2304644.1 CRISPR-associated protein [Bacteroides sp. OttesenSCG-928-D19]
MLINLSNHPSSTWDKRQLQAAAVYGNIIDLPFPAVEASGDEDYIELLAVECANKVQEIAGECEVTVHLMGEMTLTFAVLRLLQEKQIECIASTSNRIVTESEPGHKEVVFKFERFRKYSG